MDPITTVSFLTCRRIDPYVTSSRRIILVGYWNAVFDPKLDRGVARQDNLDMKYLDEFVAEFDLVDKFCERHPNKIDLDQ